MPATPIYPLALHDALPISQLEQRALERRQHSRGRALQCIGEGAALLHGLPEIHAETLRRAAPELHAEILERVRVCRAHPERGLDRKSTRLNSSHGYISYAGHPDLPARPTRRSSDLPA